MAHTKMLVGGVYRRVDGDREYTAMIYAMRKYRGKIVGIMHSVGFVPEVYEEGTDAFDAWKLVGAFPMTVPAEDKMPEPEPPPLVSGEDRTLIAKKLVPGKKTTNAEI